GVIVNIASVNGLAFFANEPYSAAKAGVINLTRSMAVRYGHHGIRAVAIAPGTIRTPIWQERVEKVPEIFEKLLRWYPLGRAGEPAARTIDADGLFVCPGFVDMHTHSDLRLLANPAHEAKVHQGVTLEVLGQDGLSYAPVNDEVLEQLRGQLAGWNDDPPGFDWSWRTVGEYLDRLDADGIAVNAAYLAPHGTIRMCAMGYDDRAPTDDELAQMKRLLVEALEDGAVGLSTGLTYTPGMYADDDEIVALCEIVRDYGGYYTPHHRNYGSHALEAYADCIEIARRSGVPPPPAA